MRGKRAYIKTDGENYLSWSGPIRKADKSKFLRGDFEISEEVIPSSEEITKQEQQEVHNIKEKQENEVDKNDTTNGISSTKEKLKELFDKGILTEEEYENKIKEHSLG